MTHRLCNKTELDFTGKLRPTIMAISMVFCVVAVCAQGFFDDKVYKKPVPHISDYNNDYYSLVSIVRDDMGTAITINYHDAYRNEGGWMNIDADDCVQDMTTGKKYPVVFTTGIPKNPERFNFTKSGPVDMNIALIFPALPENVKELDTGFGLHHLDISNVPIQHNATFQKFPVNVKNPNGKLQLYSIAEMNGMLYLTFFYTSQNYSDNDISINPATALTDVKSGKSYPMKSNMGIPVSPNKMSCGVGNTMAFTLVFDSPLADGVESVNLIESPNSSFNIQGIKLR